MYQYKPFEHPNGYRYVLLLPGQCSEEIECFMANDGNLDNPSTYCAVSYSWGSEETPKTIKINGDSFPVTENLHCCLVNLRRPNGALPLWIDAICINQKNIKEKNVQVPKMTQIYEKARQILVWLGPEDQTAIAAIEIIRLFHRYAVGRLGHPEGLLPKELSCAEEDMFGISRTDGTYTGQWAILRTFFDRTWWNRVWTLQEGTSSAETIFICGNQTIPREQMVAAGTLLGLIQMRSGYEITRDLAPENPFALERVRTARKNCSERLDLLELLRTLRNRQATDPRDKVFAALTMARDTKPGDIPTDYNLDVSQVYISTVKFHLEQKRNLDIFGCVGEAILNGLPSWTPDWSQWNPETPSPLPKELKNDQGRRPLYSASAGLGEKLPDNQPFATIDGKRLILKGVRFDSIASLSSHGEDRIDDWSVLKEWSSFVKEPLRNYQPTKETMATAFWRTMTADFVRADGQVICRGSEFGWTLRSRDMITLSVPFEKTDLLESKVQAPMIMKEATINRKFAHTAEHGYIGLMPRRAEVDDLIYVLHGGQVPFVLRKSDEAYTFIGECYVHGIMDGECLNICETVETVILH